MPQQQLIALDKSARTVDIDGRMHVEKTNISKACVNQYFGREIPGWQELGLDAGRLYSLLRAPEELEKAASTFARLPILSTHEPITVQTHRPDLVVGAIGSDVIFDGEYLTADISIWDENAIAGIESKKISELSCGYRYNPVMLSGEFNGIPYDGIMTNIVGNHLAIVEKGRAGPDVVVADAMPDEIKNPTQEGKKPMKMTKLGAALHVLFSAASPVIAADSALESIVGTLDKKTVKPDDLINKICALDAAIDRSKIAAIVTAMGLDESEEEEEKDKPAEDEDDEEEEKEDVKAAMDSKINLLRAEFKAAAEAREDVREVVGSVFGMDSAAEIYGFALDHLKVDHKGINDVAALKAMYKLASKKPEQSPRLAQDSGPANDDPNIKRIRRL